MKKVDQKDITRAINLTESGELQKDMLFLIDKLYPQLRQSMTAVVGEGTDDRKYSINDMQRYAFIAITSMTNVEYVRNNLQPK